MQPAERPRHYAFVNALRGVAALLVMVFHQQIHTFYHYPKEQIPTNTATWWLVFGFFDLGKYAVAVFFMVSGFLIPATLRKRDSSLRQFVISRFFRLYPAYWVSIGLMVGAMASLGRLGEVSMKNVAVNLTMFQKFLGQADFVGVFWTLQIELVFYILVALMFKFGKINSRWPAQLFSLGGALLCAAARLATGKALPVALFLALMLMFLGDTLRANQSGEVDDKSMWKALWVAVIGVSTDPVEKQKEFKEKNNFDYPLLADTDKKVVKAFGQSGAMMASREAYLIDRSGKVVYHDKGQTEKQAEMVPAFLKSNKG